MTHSGEAQDICDLFGLLSLSLMSCFNLLHLSFPSFFPFPTQFSLCIFFYNLCTICETVEYLPWRAWFHLVLPSVILILKIRYYMFSLGQVMDLLGFTFSDVPHFLVKLTNQRVHPITCPSKSSINNIKREIITCITLTLFLEQKLCWWILGKGIEA